MRDNLVEKIQVLISNSDLNSLYTIINRKAVIEQTRAVTVSAYVRELILKDIIENIAPEQKGFAKDEAKKVVQEFKDSKTHK